MKKQYFILSVIASILAIINVKAQNTPIDDFLKKYPSREGVTNVSMSQQILQSIFAPPRPIILPSARPSASTSTSEEVVVSGFGLISQNLKAPESYGSVSISREDIPSNLFADFKTTLLSSRYEQVMEMNKENSSILGYYIKKINDKTNEIVVLRQKNNQFSAIYIKGEIEINQLDSYLTRIKNALSRMGASNQIGIQSDFNFAFAMPSFDDFKMPNIQEFNFKFNPDSLKFKMEEDYKLRWEKSMQGVKDIYRGNE